MKKKMLFLTLLITSNFLLVSNVWSISHEKPHDMKSHDMKADGSGQDQHAGMLMGESMVILGQSAVSGVNGMAHLSDVSKQMAAMGRSETNHFMMMFSEVKTGQAIDKGVVALKIKNPAGETSAPIKMIGMGGHFGADITLREKGEYLLLVGTKLADGVKRQYQFTFVLE